MKPPATGSGARRCWCVAWRAIALTLLLALQTAAAAEHTQPFSEGRLWRVSKRGIGDSFVFGTIHVADPRVSIIAKPVDDALRQSRLLAMELVPQASDGAVDDLEQLDGGQSLEPLIGPDAFARLRDELRAQDVPLRVIERMKPWAALMRITRFDAAPHSGNLDLALLAAARGRRLRVTSLELVDEQVAAFDAVPLATQVAVLGHALAHRDALAGTLEPTIGAWLRGDLAALARITDGASEAFPGMAAHYRELARHVIDGRTVLMHYRLFMPLREGRVFAAVGATHLYGTSGLLAMLQRDGYRVTKIW